jgi:hypothetical protein
MDKPPGPAFHVGAGGRRAAAAAAAQRALAATGGSLEEALRDGGGSGEPVRARGGPLDCAAVTSDALMALMHAHPPSALPDAAAPLAVAATLTSICLCTAALSTHPTLGGLAEPLLLGHDRFLGRLFNVLALAGVSISLSATLLMGFLSIGMYGVQRIERLVLAVGVHSVTLLQHGTVLARGERYYVGAFGKPISVRAPRWCCSLRPERTLGICVAKALSACLQTGVCAICWRMPDR